MECIPYFGIQAGFWRTSCWLRIRYVNMKTENYQNSLSKEKKNKGGRLAQPDLKKFCRATVSPGWHRLVETEEPKHKCIHT